jgi:HEAT repeat protein
VVPLTELLEHNNPALVAQAVSLLQRLGSVATDKLMFVLEDSKKSTARQAAARILGQLKDLKTLPVLAQAVRQDPDPEVRLEVVRALKAFSHSDSLDWLATAVKDDYDKVRLEAVRLAGTIGGKPAIRILITALTDTAPVVRLLAVETLDKLRAVEAIPALLTLCKDPSSHVRAASANALLKFRTPEALEAVIKSNTTHVSAAEEALVAQNTIETLRTALLYGSVDTQMRVVERLPAFGAKATSVLALALKNPNVPLRQKAALALAETKDENAVVPLLEVTKDPEPIVREAVAKALGALKQFLAIDPLCVMLNDNNTEVRRSAAISLGRIGSKATSRLLSELAMAQDKWWVRLGVATAFGIMKDRQNLNVLKKLLKDEDSDVRATVCDALGNIRDAHAVKPLSMILSDSNEVLHVRKAACRALKQIGTPEALEWVRRYSLC